MGQSLSATAMPAGKGNDVERETYVLECGVEHMVHVGRGTQEACVSASKAGAAGGVKCKMSAMVNVVVVMENVIRRGGELDKLSPFVIVMKASWESTARRKHLVRGTSIQKKRRT